MYGYGSIAFECDPVCDEMESFEGQRIVIHATFLRLTDLSLFAAIKASLRVPITEFTRTVCKVDRSPDSRGKSK